MRKTLITLAALAVTFATVFLAVPASSASRMSADPSCVTPGGSDWKAWEHASWGSARICYDDPTEPPMDWFRIQTDDTLTDGYCVHTESFSNGAWFLDEGSQSCGPIATTGEIRVFFDDANPVRLVRGPCVCNGVGVNFLTLYP